MKKYYVYVYLNPLKNHEPFYVGKGSGTRLVDHLRPSSINRDPNKHKTSIIKKILDSGLNPKIDIIFESEDETLALAEEVRIIADIGRADLGKGPLANMTDGGEGTANKVFTQEYRNKLSRATKKAFADGKLKTNLEAFKYSQLGKKQNPDHVKKRADAKRGKPLSQETRAKISEAHRKIRSTEEWKAKASLAQKGKQHSLGHVLKCIENNPRSRPVEILGLTFPSIGQAIKATGLTPGKVRSHPTFKLL